MKKKQVFFGTGQKKINVMLSRIPRKRARQMADSPGVDAIFAAEGVFPRKASVVKLQGWETSLIEAYHFSMGQWQCSAVRVIA